MDEDRKPKNKFNPLLFETVVEKIFSFVSDNDLDQYRSVCKVWQDEALRAEKKRHHVIVSSLEQVQSLILKLETNPSHQVSSLFINKMCLDEPLLQELIQRHSSTISIFRVEDCNVTSIETLHAMIRGFPNLNNLTLGTLQTPDNRSYHRLFPILGPDGRNMTFPGIHYLDYTSYSSPVARTLLSSTIMTFPNINTLVCKNLSLESPEKFNNLRLPFLKKLSIILVPGRGLQTRHLEALMRLKLTLKYLYLDICSNAMDPSILKAFIESQSPTLQNLTLDQITENRPSVEKDLTICPFPLSAPNLRVLTLGKMFIRNFPLVLNCFPKLRDVALPFNYRESWARILPKKVPVYESIRNLTLSTIDSKSLENLAKSFVHTSSLKLNSCSDELLEVVFREMKNLRVLVCSDGGNEGQRITDFGITAISPDTLDTSLSNGEIKKLLADHRKRAYIGDLKHLEFLYIHFGNPPTEHAIWHGILELESLRFLVIEGMQLPNKVINAITQHNDLNMVPMISNDNRVRFAFRDVSYHVKDNEDLRPY